MSVHFPYQDLLTTNAEHDTKHETKHETTLETEPQTKPEFLPPIKPEIIRLRYFNPSLLFAPTLRSIATYDTTLTSITQAIPFVYNVTNSINTTLLVKPLHNNGIINDYLSPDFDKITWNNIPSFEASLSSSSSSPSTQFKKKYSSQYDTTMATFQHLFHSYLYSFSLNSSSSVFQPLKLRDVDANPHLGQNLCRILDDDAEANRNRSVVQSAAEDASSSTISSVASTTSFQLESQSEVESKLESGSNCERMVLPYPVEQMLLSSVPIIQDYALNPTTYSQDELDHFVTNIFQNNSTISSSVRFHYIILSIYTSFFKAASWAARDYGRDFNNAFQNEAETTRPAGIFDVLPSYRKANEAFTHPLLDKTMYYPANKQNQYTLQDPITYPIFTPQYFSYFFILIHRLFAAKIIPFEQVSPLTITLLLDIYAISFYYIKYYWWTTLDPTANALYEFSPSGDGRSYSPLYSPPNPFYHVYPSSPNDGVSFQSSLNAALAPPVSVHSMFYIANHDAFLVPPSILNKDPTMNPEILTIPNLGVIDSHPSLSDTASIDDLFRTLFQLPTFDSFLDSIVPKSHRSQVANLYLNHVAFYIHIEAEFIQKTYEIKWADKKWIQPKDDFALLHDINWDSESLAQHVIIPCENTNSFLSQHEFSYEPPDTTQVFSLYLLSQLSRSTPYPMNSPYNTGSFFYTQFVKPHIDPIMFPVREILQLKMLIQKYSANFQVQNFNDISSILANGEMPLHNRYLAVGYIARLLHMNSRFNDLSVLLTKYNIVPNNPLLTLVQSITLPQNQQFRSQTQYHSTHAKIGSLASALQTSAIDPSLDFSYFNTVLNQFDNRTRCTSIPDNELQYLFLLYMWMKYQNNGSFGISPLSLSPASADYQHYYHYYTASDISTAFVTMASHVYQSVISSVIKQPSNKPLVVHNVQLPYRCYRTPFTTSSALEIKEHSVAFTTRMELLIQKGLGSQVIEFNLNNRINPSVLEPIISSYMKAQFYSLTRDALYTLPHMYALTVSDDDYLKDYRDSSIALRDISSSFTTTFRKFAERIIYPSICLEKNWFHHFSAVINHLHFHQSSIYSLTGLHSFDTQTNLFSSNQINTHNMMKSLYHNFIFFAYENSLQSHSISSRQNKLNVLLSSRPLHRSTIPNDVLSPVSEFLHHSQLLSTFALLLQDLFHMFSDYNIEQTSQVFEHFFDALPELKTYLENVAKNKTFAKATTALDQIEISERLSLVSSYFLTPLPHSTSLQLDSDLSTTPAPASIATKGLTLAVQTTMNKFNIHSKYSLNALYLYNTLHPFIRFNVAQQLALFIRKTLFCCGYHQIAENILRLKFAQSMGSMPAYHTYLSSPWFFPQFPHFEHGSRLMDAHFVPIPLHEMYYSPPDPTNAHHSSNSKPYSLPIRDVRHEHNPPLEFIAHLDPTITASEYSLVDNPYYIEQLHLFWEALYSTGALHIVSQHVHKIFPFELLPQMLHNLLQTLETHETNPIFPLTYNIDLIEPTEDEGDCNIQQNYIYELTNYSGAKKNPHLRLFNLMTMQSFFLQPTLPYFAPSLHVAIFRIAMHAAERLTHLWVYHIVNYAKNLTSTVHTSFKDLRATILREIIIKNDQLRISCFEKLTLGGSGSSASGGNFQELFKLTNQNIITKLAELQQAERDGEKAFKINQIRAQLEGYQSLLRVSVSDLDSSVATRFNVFYEQIEFYLDLYGKNHIEYQEIPPLEPYEYVCLWLSFGTHLLTSSTHSLSSSTIFDRCEYYSSWAWGLITEHISAFNKFSVPTKDSDNSTLSPSGQQFHLFEKTNHDLYLQLQKLVNVESDCQLEYNFDFLFDLVITLQNHDQNNNLMEALAQSISAHQDFQHYEDYVLESTRPFPPLTQPFQYFINATQHSSNMNADLDVQLYNRTQLSQAMAILDYDIPAFSTPWSSHYSQSLGEPVNIRANLATEMLLLPDPNSTYVLRSVGFMADDAKTVKEPIIPKHPRHLHSLNRGDNSSDSALIQVQAEPVRQGLLYFVLDSIQPGPSFVDDITYVATRLLDKERTYFPVEKNYSLNVYLPPTDEQLANGHSFGDNVLLSLADASFLRGIQRQTPIPALMSLFNSLNPNILACTMIIVRTLDQQTSEHAQLIKRLHIPFFDTNYSLKCTVEQYIQALYPSGFDKIIEQIKQIQQ